MLELVESGRVALENDIHVIARGVLLVGNTREIAFVHLLDRFDFATGAGNLGGDPVNHFFDPFLFAGRIEYEQTFVFFH